MKKALLLTVAALFLIAGMAVAGKNAGGVLVIHGDPAGLTFCTDQDIPEVCEDFVTRIDVAGGAPANLFSWVIAAAFPPNASPGMQVVVYGIEYAGVAIAEDHNCGDFALGDDAWPQSGTGIGVTWTDDNVQTGLLTPVTSFVGYNYDGDLGSFTIIAHPTQGLRFGDDSFPMEFDDVADVGILGFFQDGYLPCPDPIVEPEPGACCFDEGGEQWVCVILLDEDCLAAGGTWDGSDSCDPNPCPFTPILDGSWGSIKATYR